MPSDRLREILLYGMARSTVDGLLAVRGLILAVLLGPEAFAAWVLFRLAASYLGFAQLGVRSGLEFLVARAQGEEGGQGTEWVFWRTASGFVLAVFGTLAGTILVSSFLVPDPLLAMGMRWFAWVLLLEQIWFMGLAFTRARGNLRRYAVGELVYASLQVTMAAVLTPFFGLAGAFAGVTVATALSLLLLSKPLRVKPGFSLPVLRKMLRVGLPVLVSLFLGLMVTSVDRLIVAARGDMSLLGLYGFAFSVAGLAGLVATVLRTVVYPEVYASVPSLGVTHALRAHLESTVLPFSWIAAPVLGFFAILSGPVIALLLPEYLEAIPATRLLIFLGLTSGLERLVSVGLIAAERQAVLPPFSAGALALNACLAFLALHRGYGLQGVAAATLFSNAAYAMGKLWYLNRVAGRRRAAKSLAGVLGPLAWSAGLVLLLSYLGPGYGFGSATVSTGLYLLAVLPILPKALSELRKARGALGPVESLPRKGPL